MVVLAFTRASATSKRDVICREVEQLTLTVNPACAMTALYRVENDVERCGWRVPLATGVG